mgnify:CR=1 FL=1
MTFDISKIIIPTNPGIYLMKDDADKIIYIGKAKNLKIVYVLILIKIKTIKLKN